MLRAGWPPGARIPEWGQSGGSGALWGTLGRLGRRGRFGGRGSKRLGSGAPPPPTRAGCRRDRRDALSQRRTAAEEVAEWGRPRGGRDCGYSAPRGALRSGTEFSSIPGVGGGPLLDFPARPGSGRASRGRGRDTTVVGNSGCRGRPPPSGRS